jgi:hypothetical protein
MASSQLLMLPMPIGKFVETLQKLCESCGATEIEARQYTTYSLRRFLLTVAGNLKTPESMAEAVGDWQQAASSSPLPPARATDFNNDRGAVAGDIKTRLLLLWPSWCVARTQPGPPGTACEVLIPGRSCADGNFLPSRNIGLLTLPRPVLLKLLLLPSSRRTQIQTLALRRIQIPSRIQLT